MLTAISVMRLKLISSLTLSLVFWLKWHMTNNSTTDENASIKYCIKSFKDVMFVSMKQMRTKTSNGCAAAQIHKTCDWENSIIELANKPWVGIWSGIRVINIQLKRKMSKPTHSIGYALSRTKSNACNLCGHCSKKCHRVCSYRFRRMLVMHMNDIYIVYDAINNEIDSTNRSNADANFPTLKKEKNSLR